jgi:hypothetical protein
MITATAFVSRGTATRNVIRPSLEISGDRRIDCAAATPTAAPAGRVLLIGRVAGSVVAITAAAIGLTAAVGCGGCCGFTGALGEHAKPRAINPTATPKLTTGTLIRASVVMGDRLYPHPQDAFCRTTIPNGHHPQP